MAFVRGDLSQSVSPIINNYYVWDYVTTDDIATVVTSGYFDSGYDLFRNNDFIRVVADDGDIVIRCNEVSYGSQWVHFYRFA